MPRWMCEFRKKQISAEEPSEDMEKRKNIFNFTKTVCFYPTECQSPPPPLSSPTRLQIGDNNGLPAVHRFLNLVTDGQYCMFRVLVDREKKNSIVFKQKINDSIFLCFLNALADFLTIGA